MLFEHISSNIWLLTKTLAQQHRPLLEQIKTKVIEAASNDCFPPELVLGFVSRLSIENGALQTGWHPCKLNAYSQ